jgi:hypothetical protein
MRNIKFRLWNGTSILKKSFKIHFDGQVEAALPYSENPYVEILMQYTGLKDRNGVEIYEGDVIVDLSHKCRWLVGLHCFGFVALNPWDKLDFVMLDDYTFEVVGNIYENPELLESE